jgi:phosphohistidine swiveling domain-containing protein
MKGSIVIASRSSPLLTVYLLEAAGLVIVNGGILSHAAAICRCLRIPCIVGVSGALIEAALGHDVEIDAGAGAVRVVASATPETLSCHIAD